jgi:hypothetical protein
MNIYHISITGIILQIYFDFNHKNDHFFGKMAKKYYILLFIIYFRNEGERSLRDLKGSFSA